MDGLADDRRRAAEETGPEAVADDGNGAGAGCGVVGWLDGAAESGLNAELLVEVSGDEFAGDGVGVAIDGGRETLSKEIFECEEIFKHRLGEVLLAQELVDRVGEGVSYRAAIGGSVEVAPETVEGAGAAVSDDGEEAKLVGLGHGQAIEQDAFGEGEDDGIGSDAEGE